MTNQEIVLELRTIRLSYGLNSASTVVKEIDALIRRIEKDEYEQMITFVN